MTILRERKKGIIKFYYTNIGGQQQDLERIVACCAEDISG